MSAAAADRRRRTLKWGIALLALGLSAALVTVVADRTGESAFFAGKYVSETFLCEPDVRDVTLAYVASGEAPLVDAQRRATLARVRAVLSRLPDSIRVAEAGMASELSCSGPLFPRRPGQLTVLVAEQNDMQRLSTLHFDPARPFCGPGRPRQGPLDGFLIAQDLGGQLRELNTDLFDLWAANLPRIVNPSCRGGFALPGTNHVDPRHARVVQSIREDPPKVGGSR